MGIDGLMPITRPNLEPFKLADFRGKKVAVDGFPWLYQAFYRKDRDVLNHFKMKIKQYRNYGVDPVIIFDGKPPRAKMEELQKRKAARERSNSAKKPKTSQEFQEEKKNHLEDDDTDYEEDFQEEYNYEDQETETKSSKSGKCQTSISSAVLTKRDKWIIVEQLKRLLSELQVEWIQAFGETDFEAALLEILEYVAATETIDGDFMVHMCKKILYELYWGTGRMYNHSVFKKVWKRPFCAEIFRCLGVLMGGDYLPGGLKHFGPSRALDVYQEVYDSSQGGEKISGPELEAYILKAACKTIREPPPIGFKEKYENAIKTMKYSPVFEPGTRVLRPFIQDGMGGEFFNKMVEDGDDDFDWEESHFVPYEECKIEAAPDIGEHLFMCPVCDEKLESPDDYDKHREDKHWFVCPIEKCQMSFRYKSELLIHLDKHSPEKKHFCGICNKAFQTKRDLWGHLSRTHAPIIELKCDYCESKFTRLDTYKTHLRKKHDSNYVPKTDWLCQQCGKVLRSSDALLYHMRQVHHINPKQYSCTECAAVFSLEVYLYRHMRAEHPKKHKEIHVCDLCNKAFDSPHLLYSHSLTSCTEDEARVCEKCGRSFKGRRNYNQHIESHAARENQLFMCETCGESYSNKQNLERHMPLHTKEYNEAMKKCNDCGKDVPLKSFPQHLLSHKNRKMKKYQCPQCPKFFSMKWGLDKHILSHQKPEEQEMIQCDKCPKKIARKSFRNHMLYHKNLEEKNYQCKICGKCFGQNSGLNTHLGTHKKAEQQVVDTKGKKLCDKCQKYISIKTFRNHKQYHKNLKEERFKCKICGKCFGWKADLQGHVKTHKKDEKDNNTG